MTATLAEAIAAAVATPPRPLPSVGARTRVALTGTGDPTTVHACLTRAWRLIGGPIVVVLPPKWGPVERAAADWAADHALPGCGLLVQHGPPEQPCVLIDAAVPTPWCGCVRPPCSRCLASTR